MNNDKSLLDSIADGTKSDTVLKHDIPPNDVGPQKNPPTFHDETQQPGMRLQSSACIIRLLSLGQSIDHARELYGSITTAKRVDQVQDILGRLDKVLQSARKDVGILTSGDK